MAKRRRLDKSNSSTKVTKPRAIQSDPVTASGSTGRSGLLNFPAIAAGLFAGLLAYATYYPADSAEVESGNALWFCTLALLPTILIFAEAYRTGRWQALHSPSWSKLIDLSCILLAGWIMIAAFATSPPGNIRDATNEAWLWVVGSLTVIALRRLFGKTPVAKAALAILVACAAGLAIHCMHQQWISLPETRAKYLADPDRVVQQLDLDAPKGSAERLILESRLFDGGPSATFALANSVAGVFVVGFLLLAGAIGCHWRELLKQSALLCFLLIMLVSIAAGIFLCRSRGATLSVMLGSVAVLLLAALRHARFKAVLPILARCMIAFAFLVVVVGVGLAAFGDPEWFDQAPESIAFRFQYWRTTVRMTLDRPAFSAGPGNFQKIYDRYRELDSSEQIAEPHNFFFETLASGGFFAAVVLVALFTFGSAYAIGMRSKFKCTHPQNSDHQTLVRAMWWGVGLSLLLVWLLGFATRQLPDWQAHIFAIPVSVLAGYVAWKCLSAIDQISMQLACLGAMLGLLIHWSVSGGWTVPGVCVFGWTLFSILTAVDTEKQAESSSRSLVSAGAIGLGGSVVATAALVWFSLGPVQESHRMMMSADYFAMQGDRGQLESALDQAIQADPWSTKANLRRADLLHWDVVLGRRQGERS